VLKENGIDPDKDVTLEFYQSGDEVASQLTLKPDAIGMLPEPKVSAFLSGAPSYRKALDMTTEWNKVAGEGNTLIQGVFIARKDFIAEHPQLVAAFLEDYDASQNLVNTDLDKGAEYVVEAGIIPKAPLAKKAIPGCNITFLEGEAMKKGVAKCLAVLFEANPKSVGGSLPADDIYFIR
ncbi:MAG: ABC transporter substrate-binding protein, partial [Clostridia bacterium]|nr:ABC transporter substrate-binding protein [Clostridia bacterium]